MSDRTLGELLEPFNGFNPLDPGQWPAFGIDSIIQRAQALVRYHSLAQLSSFATAINWMILQEDVARWDAVIKKLALPESPLWLHAPDGTERTEDAVHDLMQRRHTSEELENVLLAAADERPRPESVHILKACIAKYDLSTLEGVEGAKPYELFAIHSLQLVGETIFFLQTDNGVMSSHFGTRQMMGALESVCEAEHLRHNEKRDVEFRLVCKAAQDAMAYSDTRARAVRDQITKALPVLVQREVEKKQSLANARSHETHNEWRRQTFLLYEQNMQAWNAIDAAGDVAEEALKGAYFQDLAKKKKLTPALETVIDYIREYRREVLGQRRRGRPRGTSK